MTLQRLDQIRWLVSYDLRTLWRDRGALAVLAAGLLLSLWGLFQGADFQAGQARTVQAAQAREVGARADAQGVARRYFAAPDAPEFTGAKWWRSPYDLRGYAFYAHVGFAAKPLLPGAALAVGEGDLLPPVVRVRADSPADATSAYELEHPARLAMGRFDLMFCVVYLWPLLLLALNLPVLNLERERRQLGLLKLQGVPSLRLLLARTLARSGLAALLLMAVVAVASWVCHLVPATTGGTAALGAWSAWLLAWFLFWSGITACVAAVSRHRVTAAFAGFAAWVIVLVLLPALLTAAITLAVPQPGRETYVRALRDAGDQFAQHRGEALARFYDDHPAWRPAQTSLDKLSSSVTRIPRLVEMERLMAPVEREFADARERREALFDAWLWLSPASVVGEGLIRIAGNDTARHRRFEAELLAHHAELRRFFNGRVQEAALREEGGACGREGCWGFEDFSAVPRFQASAALHRAVLPSSAPLWVMALLLWGAAAWRLSPGAARAGLTRVASR